MLVIKNNKNNIMNIKNINKEKNKKQKVNEHMAFVIKQASYNYIF